MGVEPLAELRGPVGAGLEAGVLAGAEQGREVVRQPAAGQRGQDGLGVVVDHGQQPSQARLLAGRQGGSEGQVPEAPRHQAPALSRPGVNGVRIWLQKPAG